MSSLLWRIKRSVVVCLKIPVYVYKYAISPWLAPRCRFYPTCSEYCLQALEKHGALAGLFLSVRRVLACHPWSGRSGFDPVPTHPYKCSCSHHASHTPDTKTDGTQ